MPSRMLRDWTDSNRFDGISAEGERLFVRLIMKADDYGRFYGDLRLIKANCFPLTESLRTNDLSRWLDELSTRGLILRYEAEGRKCLAIVNYGQRLKKSRAKHPALPGKAPDWLPVSEHFRELPGTSDDFPPEGEEKKKGNTKKEGEAEGALRQSTPPPIDSIRLTEISNELSNAYPNSPKAMTKREIRELEDAMPVLLEFTGEDWQAVSCWVKASERQRGKRLWPRDRSEFMQHAGTAIADIREWWRKAGKAEFFPLLAAPPPVITDEERAAAVAEWKRLKEESAAEKKRNAS